MAAIPNNSRGLAGVLHNAKLYGVDFHSLAPATGLTPESAIHNGVLATVEQGARAVNVSAGFLGPQQPNGAGEELQNLNARNAARLIAQMLEYGHTRVVIVQSAGNFRRDAIRNGLFASVTAHNTQLDDAQMTQMVLNRILVAGAMEMNQGNPRQTSFTAIGDQVGLYAPGAGLFMASTGNGYQINQGTSFAAPQVAATAAWMLTANPALDAGQVSQLLKMNAVSPPVVRDFTGGNNAFRMLDVRRALDSVFPAPMLEPAQGSPVEIIEADKLIIIPERTPLASLLDLVNAWGGELSHEIDAPLLGTGQRLTVTAPLGQQVIYTIVVVGDLNGDGRVDALDAQLLLREFETPGVVDLPGPVFDAAVGGLSAQDMFDKGME
jgi:hypothetical protein